MADYSVQERNYQYGRQAAESWINSGESIDNVDEVCTFRTEAFANGFHDRIAEERKQRLQASAN